MPRRARRGGEELPNLTDSDWLWGGAPENIKETITNGRNGVMPPFGPALGADGVKDVANYVRSMNGLAHDSVRRAARQGSLRVQLRGLPRCGCQGQP